MHFMHAVQMISLLNVCMLIIEPTFYSLTTLRHKIGKSNVISNAFSRLSTHTFQMNNVNKKKILNLLYDHSIEVADEKLNNIFIAMIYYITLIKMSDDFKHCLKKVYIENKHWFSILKMLNRAFIFTIKA